MAYNRAQATIALREYTTDPRYAAMQSAMGPVPVYPSGDPQSPPARRGGTPDPMQVIWDGLSPQEQSDRITAEATRQAALTTQGLLWLVAMEELVTGDPVTTISQTELYEIVKDVEEAALGQGALQMLNNMYSLPQLDFSSGGKAITQFERLFQNDTGPSRTALDAALAGPQIPRYRKIGLPPPYLGLFELMVKRAR